MIDGHAHLNEIADIDGAIRRAASAGVATVVAVGMDTASNRITLDLASRFPGIIYPAVGYHPWSIVPGEIDENLAFIREHLPVCIALGEIGIDYKTKLKKQIQWDVFERLLAVAKEMDKPVIIHSRYSHSRTFELTESSGIERAVFHWYSGPVDLVEKIMDSGYFVSASPALAYSPPHRAAIAAASLERILVETDAPVEYQGKVSEPADLVDTVRELAGLKGISFDEAARITEENTRRFYRI
jgi:TatD DNase family protein